ncbi:hypothetical protein IFR05_010829 [Cadophora sp. M221]|nr:hypothetical protein IFR05_010829 [Cadophora sp. M221]
MFYIVLCVLPRATYSINDRLPLVFTSLLAHNGFKIIMSIALSDSHKQAQKLSFRSQEAFYSEPHFGALIAIAEVFAARTLEDTLRGTQQAKGGLRYSRTGKGARSKQISRDVRVMAGGGGSEKILGDLAFVREGRGLEEMERERGH